MIGRKIRKGTSCGWYSDDNIYNICFKDTDNGMSFKQSSDEDFEIGEIPDRSRKLLVTTEKIPKELIHAGSVPFLFFAILYKKSVHSEFSDFREKIQIRDYKNKVNKMEPKNRYRKNC